MPLVVPSSSMSSVAPESGMEVDYDRNLTKLYEAICDCDWDVALQVVKDYPQQARTWVVRYYEHEEYGAQEVMWRFLPIHSACARQPPAPLVSALLKAYPDGARCVDDQGMYPLHYACGNRASREVIRLLLLANSQAARKKDPRGMLPIHFLACWGPSSVSIIDMVLVANREVGNIKDDEGKTPLDLAHEGDYEERDAVVTALRRWMERSSSPRSGRAPSPAPSSRSPRGSRASSPAPSSVHRMSGASSQRSSSRAPVSPSSPRYRLAVSVDEPEVMKTPRPKRETRETMLSPRESPSFDKGGRDSPAGESSHTVSRLRYDLTKIRAEQNGLRLKCDELSSELDLTRARLREKEDSLVHATTELASTKTLLKECQTERDRLRTTVDDLANDKNMYQHQNETMTDRLQSLSESLASIAEEQEKLMITVKSRGSDLAETSKSRLQKLKMLVVLEEETSRDLVAQCRDDDMAIEKQMKDIDSIASVISTII